MYASYYITSASTSGGLNHTIFLDLFLTPQMLGALMD